MEVRWVLFFAVQAGMGALTCLAAGPTAGRRALAAVLAAVALPLPFLAPPNPLGRTFLSFLALLPIMKAVEISAASAPWPPRLRAWQGVSLFDVRATRRVAPGADGALLAGMLLHAAIVASVLVTLGGLQARPSFPARDVLRLLLGVALVYSFVEATEGVLRFGHRLFGIDVPPIQRLPIASRSAGEFWAERWNRPTSAWLHRFAFRPLARRRRLRAGLLAAFVASAFAHVCLVAAALELASVLSMGAFFLVQGAIVWAESELGVRAWPAMRGRAWTLLVLLGPSPLFVNPFLLLFQV